jgi:hypothetical protein
MIERRCSLLVTTILMAAVLYLLAVESRTASLDSPTSQSPQRSASEGKKVEQVYKNIQVLNGLPASELDGVMEFMSAALGVGCTHCHTNPWDSDSKTAKLGTRRMILMTRAINKENFSGNPAITCYTCHQGQPRTVPLPPVDLASSHSSTDESTPSTPADIPSMSAIIDRYLQAIGGESAIEGMKTRVLRGIETTTNRMTAPVTMPIEIYQTSENKLLVNRGDSGGSSSRGFDGLRGWIRDSKGLRDMDEKELAVVSRDADFYSYLKLKRTYPQMRVLAKERIGGRDTYVVGATARDDRRERLFFDAKSGLLIRKYISFKTAFGSIPEVTDFDDYREVNGIKLPFTIKWSRAPFGIVRRFAEIRLNANVDGAKFQRPAK